MLPNAVITITGSSGSSSLAARSTPKPSPSGSRRSDSTTPGRVALQGGDRFRLIARFDDGVALRLEREAQHRAQRVLVLDQQNRRIGRAPRASAHRSQPGGTPALRASSSRSAIAFLSSSTLFCRRSSSLSALLAVALDDGALRRIVRADEIGGQRIDAALHRVGEHLVALELALQLLHAPRPVGLILSGPSLLVFVFRPCPCLRLPSAAWRCRCCGGGGDGPRFLAPARTARDPGPCWCRPWPGP